MINGLCTMVNERQARELHMARRRREIKMAVNWTRASNLQTYS